MIPKIIVADAPTADTTIPMRSGVLNPEDEEPEDEEPEDEGFAELPVVAGGDVSTTTLLSTVVDMTVAGGTPDVVTTCPGVAVTIWKLAMSVKVAGNILCCSGGRHSPSPIPIPINTPSKKQEDLSFRRASLGKILDPTADCQRHSKRFPSTLSSPRHNRWARQ